MTVPLTPDRSPTPVAVSPPKRWWVAPLLLAGLFTLLGSLKPMHIDETANYYYAVHIADHPLDPFGFEVFWYERPKQANQVLTPPVMVYWWSLGVRLFRPFGEQPMLWKLWLFPFTLLFVFALHALLKRFARGLEAPLLWMTVLSPVILPSLNLMPDVPALAFSLSALAVFLHAIAPQRRCRGASNPDQKEQLGKAELPSSWSVLGTQYSVLGTCLLSGVLAGIGMQTKYTGCLTPVVLLLAALLFGRIRLWFVAAVPAVGIFVAWEWVTARLYGESHFLHQLDNVPMPLFLRLAFLGLLVCILGGAAPAAGLLGLVALRARRSVVIAAGVLVALGYLLVACANVDFEGQAKVESLFSPDARLDVRFAFSDILYAVWGLGLIGITGNIASRLCRLGRGRFAEERAHWRTYRPEWFLVLWLGLEVVGYFFLTPFPAVRRVMGIVIAGTVLVGRLASRTCRSGGRRVLVSRVAAFGILLGLGFLAVDIVEARTQRETVETVDGMIQRMREGGTVWFVGHWGFQYYAEHAGWAPVVPDESVLRAGDWLVLPDDRIPQQRIAIDAARTVPVLRWASNDRLPLGTVMGYYVGWTPLEHQQGPRLKVEVRRVLADHVPMSLPPVQTRQGS